MTTWPRLGAMIGMIMKIIITSDITSAICLPPKVSRTTDSAMTRVAAAPTPCRKRSASRIVKVGEKAAPNAQAR